MTDRTLDPRPLPIAVLGLGAMGSGLARNLAAAGHDITVWNRTTSRSTALAAAIGARVAPTPAAAAAGAAVVMTMVRDDEASHDVWLGPDGAVDSLGDDSVGIEASTITPAWAEELSRAVRARGSDLLEAPVVGSRPQLAASALVTLVGGDPTTLERVRPVLDVSSSVVRHCGPVGSAAVAKLAVNGLFAAQVAAYAETVGFLQRSGVTVGDAAEFLAGLPITSPALQRTLGLFAAGDDAPNFPIELVAKDLRYLVDSARRVGALSPVADAVAAAFAAAVDSGHGELDIVGLGRSYF